MKGVGVSRVRWCGLVLFLVAGVASAQGAGTGAFLRWDLEEAGPQPETVCQAVSVSWLDAKDRVLWTVPLPARMREVDREPCGCAPAGDGGVCVSELHAYRSRPRASVPPFVVGVLRKGDVLAVADMSGVLLLDVRSGKVLLDWEAPREPSPRLFVDEGRFTLEGTAGCTGSLARGRMLHRCGNRFVYFNGTAVALLQASPPGLEAAVRVEDAHLIPQRPSRVKARIPIGGGAFVLRGIVYLR
ncbi:hypothetical protein HPC49_23370 [Pyxidicoccus fallax]|uniref:Lipoprotein n=1 Tax=Pyxidicoccus fallax TaxID=394095 RepID=A0A848LJE5_9BACT|nr:hypothetical protein [Pyxidicoccus fallax]NMO17867.1 hypothetical protein [Pyxidicoccus fallax]NPC81155.1 hypothetical protein [Pyxidicoccus fallax]